MGLFCGMCGTYCFPLVHRESSLVRRLSSPANRLDSRGHINSRVCAAGLSIDEHFEHAGLPKGVIGDRHFMCLAAVFCWSRLLLSTVAESRHRL